LLTQAKALAKVDPGLEVEAIRVEAELEGQMQTTRKLREGFKSGSAKMAYLLGIDPGADLVLMDRQMAAITLVDPQQSVEQLVAQAVANGPGVREMEGLLNLINETNQKSQGLGKYLPTFDVRVAEGAFGGGPGSRSDYENRLDVLLQARWNLTDAFTRGERQRQAQSRITQAHMTYHDIQARLNMGVQEGYEASRSNQEQMAYAENQMRYAKQAHERSKTRLATPALKGSPSEVLFATRLLGGAQLGYLSAIRDYDKAQLRLWLLLGPACGQEQHH
jgi:outer membrane protein TolC